MDAKETLKTISLLKAQKMEKDDGIKLLIRDLRKSCRHPVILEAEYVPETTYAYTKPSYRMCEDCRIEEEGWGCGHQILKDSLMRVIKKVSREEIFGHRINECCCRVGNSLLNRNEEEKFGSYDDIVSGKVVEEF